MQQQNQSTHIVPTRYYLFVFISLLVLTGVTVFTAKEINFGAFNFIFAMIIALLKAGLVLFIFMGLGWDKTKINIIVLFVSLLFFFFFFVITIFDYKFRGELDPKEGIYNQEAMYAPAVKGVEKSVTKPKFISFKDLIELRKKIAEGNIPKEILEANQNKHSDPRE